MNAILQLSQEQRDLGVVTHSSGNHAQAVALAGKLLGTLLCERKNRRKKKIEKKKKRVFLAFAFLIFQGVKTTVIMPSTSPEAKRTAVQGKSLFFPFFCLVLICFPFSSRFLILIQDMEPK